MIEVHMIADFMDDVAASENLGHLADDEAFGSDWKWGMNGVMWNRCHNDWSIGEFQHIEGDPPNTLRPLIWCCLADVHFRYPDNRIFLFNDSIRTPQARAEGVFPVCYVLELLERSEG